MTFCGPSGGEGFQIRSALATLDMVSSQMNFVFVSLFFVDLAGTLAGIRVMPSGDLSHEISAVSSGIMLGVGLLWILSIFRAILGSFIRCFGSCCRSGPGRGLGNQAKAPAPHFDILGYRDKCRLRFLEVEA
jgi:hypothetical protein